MAIWHLRSDRKPTGGLLRQIRKKRRSDKGSEFLETKIGERRVKAKRCKGGMQKIRLMSADTINVTDKTGKIAKTKIVTVVENPANPNYVRRNILTKGSIVKTDLGRAVVTSRPSQDGIVNGVLLQEAKQSAA